MDHIKLIIYTTGAGKSPFLEWLKSLDKTTRFVIRSRLERISVGNLGDIKPIKGVSGLFELRVFYGSGYRIYCAKKEHQIIIVLAGGEKDNQERDIIKAKRYLTECEDLK